MVAIPSRHRSLVLLAAVVLAQVLLLAVQIRNQDQVRLIRVWAATLFSLVQRPATAMVDSIADTWNSYFALRKTRQDNETLRAELNSLRLRTAHLEGRAAEADRLAALLEFKEGHAEAPMLAARVIGAAAAGISKTIYINRGADDKITKNMGVITPDGVVGKILDVYPASAQVLLVTDKESGVGALLADSRTQGVVRGTGEPEAVMQYVINDEKVEIGERILTSGQDRIFPKDLPVGTVASAAPGSPFQKISVRPAARLDRLEEVLVLMTRLEFTPKEATAANSGPEQRKPPAKP